MIPQPGPRLAAGGTLNWKVVVAGDSNTDQGFATSNGFTGWWLQLQALAASSRLTIGDEFATGGWKWADIQAIQATINAAATATHNCLLVMMGTNNLDNNESATAVAGYAQTFLAGATAFEKKGLVWVPPQTANPTRDAQVNAYNASLASVAGCDFVVSRAGVTALSDSTNTTYFMDVLHMNGAGCGILANLALTALQANLP
jgi:hypothetical protein